MSVVLDATTPRWSRYVAIGDSFSEGLWDDPDGREAPQRGWADLLASHLSARWSTRTWPSEDGCCAPSSSSRSRRPWTSGPTW